MKINKISLITVAIRFTVFIVSCAKNDSALDPVINYPTILTIFNGKIDLENLANYANQDIPAYIRKDNSDNNPITDTKATLRKALLYDKKPLHKQHHRLCQLS